MAGDVIDLTDDQSYFDSFHISFIIYDLDEQELLLTSPKILILKKLVKHYPEKCIKSKL